MHRKEFGLYLSATKLKTLVNVGKLFEQGEGHDAEGQCRARHIGPSQKHDISGIHGPDIKDIREWQNPPAKLRHPRRSRLKSCRQGTAPNRVYAPAQPLGRT